jgi:hypothetical protein
VQLDSQVTSAEVRSDGTCCHSWPLPTACYRHSTNNHRGRRPTRNRGRSWRWSAGCATWRRHRRNNSLGFPSTGEHLASQNRRLATRFAGASWREWLLNLRICRCCHKNWLHLLVETAEKLNHINVSSLQICCWIKLSTMMDILQ